MRGSVTVFFSMIFVTVISVICVTLESARWSCAKLYFRQAAQDGIKSVFADYCNPLLEEYGVLFLDKTYGQGYGMIEKKTEEYFKFSLNPNYGNLYKRSFLYKCDADNIKTVNESLAIDGNGAVFKEAAYNYMKYRIPADFADEFLEQFNIVKQAGAVRDFFEKINSIQKDLSAVNELILDINSLIEEIESLRQTIQDLSIEISRLLATDKQDEKVKKMSKEKTALLNAAKNRVVSAVNGIINDSDAYRRVTYKVRNYLQNIADEWLNNLSISQSIKNVIKEEIENLLIYAGDKGDIYGIGRIEGILSGLDEEMEKWLKKESYTDIWIDALSEIEIEFDINNTFLKTNNFNVEKLWKELKSNSFYSFICPDYERLSTESVTPFNNRERAYERAGLFLSEEHGVEDFVKNIVFQEYISRMFSNYASQKDNTKLRYEMEYIIGGSRMDRDNIDFVIKELLFIREALNLIYIMGDTQKKNEAYSLAASCIGFSGIYPAIKALQYAILGVWAFGEAMLDVRALMSNQSVALIKTADEWRLSLDGLLNMDSALKNLSVPPKGIVVNSGLKYEDYLKFILYMQDKDVQSLRVLDLVEANIQKNYSHDFYIVNCVGKAALSADFKLRSLFGSFFGAVFYEKNTIEFEYSY